MYKSIMIALAVWLGWLPLSTSAQDATPGYEIGVYYFPGWLDDQRGAPAAKPWERIKRYPEREPLLGWYREGDSSVVEQQVDWMHAYGIDFVVFDWFWDGKPFLEHALSAFMRADNGDKLKFSLLWANHSSVPESVPQFTAMVDYWIKYYFPRANYMRIDNKPVVFVFSQQRLRDKAKAFGKRAIDLFAMADDMARKAGFPGVYFVGASEAVSYWVNTYAPTNGYDALSAYNYHRGFSGFYNPLKRPSHSYEELDEAYRMSWDWILENSQLPYVLPMTAGWNKRPWGGSLDPMHDDSQGTADEFELHLRAAKARLDRYPTKTQRTGVICCWNEFGEGSYIEPTKADGFTFLERVRKVFGVE